MPKRKISYKKGVYLNNDEFLKIIIEYKDNLEIQIKEQENYNDGSERIVVDILIKPKL